MKKIYIKPEIDNMLVEGTWRLCAEKSGDQSEDPTPKPVPGKRSLF